MGCVFVDVDGTLIAASSERRFFAHLVVSRQVGASQLGAWLGYMARDFPNARRNKAYLAGLARTDIAAAAERFVARSLETKLRAPLLHRIEWHKRNGETIVLLTGTLDEIARPLARRVGADAVVATICACTDDVYQASAPLVHPFAAAKLRLAADFARTAVSACDELMIRDQPGADAAVKLHRDRGGVASGCTPDVFAESGEIRIVFDQDRKAEHGAEISSGRTAPARQDL